MPTFSFSVLGINLLLTLIFLSRTFVSSPWNFLFIFAVSFLHPPIPQIYLLFAGGKLFSGSYECVLFGSSIEQVPETF